MNQFSRAEQEAIELFRHAAAGVPAYKDFLRKHKINPDKILTFEDFKKIPPTNKPDYISAYSLQELSWDGTLAHSPYISSSSGSTGIPFYWPRGNYQNKIVGKIFQNIFEKIFYTKEGSTLFVNLFALGTWIAGLEFYNGAKYVADTGNAINIVTPGIEKKVALDAIVRLGPLYDRIVLAGYPPFVKDVIDSGFTVGIDWSKYNVYLLTGGEAFSELWRNHVHRKLGAPEASQKIINIYGMAETGVVGHETPLTILLRKNLQTLGTIYQPSTPGTGAPALYAYNPLVRFFEVGDDQSLLLTSRAGLPLIRYNTRDQGGLISSKEIRAMATVVPATRECLSAWRTPVVYLHGRKDLSLSFYALNVYIENIKHCFESYAEAKSFSGLFTMRVANSRNFDQQFHIVAELALETKQHDTKQLVLHILKTLPTINSEYGKLLQSLGKRAHPKVSLVPYGKLDTIPGKKHRWVRKG